MQSQTVKKKFVDAGTGVKKKQIQVKKTSAKGKYSNERASSKNGGSVTLKLLAQRDKDFPVRGELEKTRRTFRHLSGDEVFRNCAIDNQMVSKNATKVPNYEII